MGNTSTFGTFTMARLGIYVSQHALNVTGNNITNINTRGYTRQALDQTSMYFGGADRYHSRFDIRANGGVLAKGVYQLRDQYLDIRYRNEVTREGEATQKLSGLQQLSDIFDEVAKGEDGDGVLEARLNDLIQQLENMSKPEYSNKDDIDSIVRSAAEALVTQFHDYANQLETLKKNLTAQFRQEIDATNTILTKIRDLNEEIRKSELFGGSALTLKDERNLLIDELAEKMGIHVTYEAEELGNGRWVEKLKITTSGNPSRTLIDGIYGSQLTILNEKNYDLGLSQLKDGKGKLMPKQPNRTEMTPTGIETWGDIKKVGSFLTQAEADAKIAEFGLNDDTKYKIGNDGSKYWYDSYEDPDTGEWVIRQREVVGFDDNGEPLKDDNGDPILKDGGKAYYVQTVESRQTRLSDTELSGGLQAMREMMTECGEYTEANDPSLKTTDPLHYDPNASTKRGVLYYQKALDTLASKFAEIMNKANMMQPEEIYQTDESGKLLTEGNPPHYIPKDIYKDFFVVDGNGDYVPETDEETGDYVYEIERDKNGNYVKNEDGTYKYAEDENGDYIVRLKVKAEYQEFMGSPLFSNSSNNNDITGITAKNISVAKGWESGEHRILRSKDPDAINQSTLQDNIAHMLTELMGDHDFETDSRGGGVYFTGTFQEMFTDTISGTLAKDTNITSTMLSNYSVTAEELYLDRDAVMGVDLNDETMNMMQFQKAYSAACRLMTTFDSMIDKLVNGTAM